LSRREEKGQGSHAYFQVGAGTDAKKNSQFKASSTHYNRRVQCPWMKRNDQK